MAIMWPRRLPQEVLNNPLRSAERRVYERCASDLDDSFTVFYSRPWLGTKPNGEEIDGECDFVIARAQSGFLALEVKGGAVSYDPQTDEWLSRDRWNIRHRIKNPVNQARASKHELTRKLRDRLGSGMARLRIRHGVILPDSARPASDLGPDMPLALFCFAEEFAGGFSSWVEQRLGLPDARADEGPLGVAGIRALEGILAQPFQLKMPLSRTLGDDEREILALSPEQFRILRYLPAAPRVAVAGGAGTGKTVLAIEQARRFAAEGKRTLVTCLNPPLATFIADALSDCALVDAGTFQSVCLLLAKEAGIATTMGADGDPLSDTYPEILLSAVERCPGLRYDALIVDEAQDLLPHWWIALDTLVSDSQGARMLVFFDNNQRIYNGLAQIPDAFQVAPFPLSANFRNTKRIHSEASRFYDGPTMEVLGPDGVEVVRQVAEERELKQKLGAVVASLVKEEGIRPEDIAVLVSGEEKLRRFGDRLGGVPRTKSHPPKAGHVAVDVVRRFKGLERPVVVVVVDAALCEDQELLYVALSRARVHLILLGPQLLLHRLGLAGARA